VYWNNNQIGDLILDKDQIQTFLQDIPDAPWEQEVKNHSVVKSVANSTCTQPIKRNHYQLTIYYKSNNDYCEYCEYAPSNYFSCNNSITNQRTELRMYIQFNQISYQNH
jgi:hypothetical protein